MKHEGITNKKQGSNEKVFNRVHFIREDENIVSLKVDNVVIEIRDNTMGAIYVYGESVIFPCDDTDICPYKQDIDTCQCLYGDIDKVCLGQTLEEDINESIMVNGDSREDLIAGLKNVLLETTYHEGATPAWCTKKLKIIARSNWILPIVG